MHPRNIYKDSISFGRLAKEFPEFAKHLKGTSSLDFHDPESIRQLAKALLKRDFKIDIDLPEDRLCPAIPNRLNYILWLSDLLADTNDHRESDGPKSPRKIVGIDIGTGASAIYPLLGCSSFPEWSFIATDIDSASISKAIENISRNDLESRIKVHDVSLGPLLLPPEVLEAHQNIDFTMCNPPFYTSIDDMLVSAKKKSVPPLSACTGSTGEMVTEGGEVAFVGRMIDESLALRDRVRWYTSMLGKRSSVVEIVKNLKEKDIANYVVGEFVQGVGRTKRWAVGWSSTDRRAGDHISRQPASPAIRSYLPFPTTFKIPLPVDSAITTLLPNVAEVIQNTCKSFPTDSFEWSDIHLPYFTTMHGAAKNIYGNGEGITSGNTWSRAARRRLKAGQDIASSDEPKFGFAIGIFIGGGSSSSGEASSGKAQHSILEDEDEKEGADEGDAWDHDFISLPASSVEPDSSQGSYVLLRWTRGVDQVLWESFCGMLRRKIVEELPKTRA